MCRYRICTSYMMKRTEYTSNHLIKCNKYKSCDKETKYYSFVCTKPRGIKMFSNFPEALKQFRSKLTAFEQTEILDYPEIWFLGLEAKKIEGVPGGAQNNGYDDENGSYIKVRSYS